MSGCGKTNCDCGCRHANPRRERRALRRSTMGAWVNNSATRSRLSRESIARGAYATGYYQPMLLPMAGDESTAVVVERPRTGATAAVTGGALALAGIMVLVNFAVLGFAGYGVYAYATRTRRR
jgi:hypothetical protein